jgi:hypothetical protein
MCDHQTLGRQIIAVLGTWAVVGLLCSSMAIPLCAAEAGGGGQQVASADYEKMWTGTFSDEQWLAMLRQRVHQPIAIWQGFMTGEIEANNTGMSYQGIQFEDSRSNVLERQLLLNGLFARQPLAFLPLFDDPDPEIVLTGAAVYMKAMNSGDFRPAELGEAKTNQIATAIREKLLPHRDVRIRWLAVEMLAQSKLMTPQDIRVAMNDPSLEIRITTAFQLNGIRTKWSWEADPDNTEEPAWGKKLTKDEFRQYDAILADILLDHLNETHFAIRNDVGTVVHDIFMRRASEIQEANPAKKNFMAPKDFDWVRSEWQRRVTTQKTWKSWWKANGIPVAAAPSVTQ